MQKLLETKTRRMQGFHGLRRMWKPLVRRLHDGIAQDENR